MERDANYLWVAAATAILVLAMVLFGLWLGRLTFGERKDLYDVAFTGPVSGLARGAEVRFNGLRVGEVIYVGIAPGQSDHVLARIEIAPGTPVRVTSRAQLAPQPIGDLTTIQISAGSDDGPLLRSQYPKNVVPALQSQPTPILELLNNSGSILVQTSMLLERLENALSDDALLEVTERLSQANRMTSGLAARRQRLLSLEQAVVQANQTIVEYRRTATVARDWVGGDGRDAVEQLNASAIKAAETIGDVSAAFENGAAPTDRLLIQRLAQLDESLTEIEAATRAVRDQIDSVRASPRSLGRAPASEAQVLDR